MHLMLINISYDQTVSTLPAGFTAGVASVVQFFENQFSDPITFNLHVGYGEVHGQALSANALGGSIATYRSFSYSQIRTALLNDAKSADDATAIATLPTSDPITGTHTWWVADVQAKALGLLPNSTTVD